MSADRASKSKISFSVYVEAAHNCCLSPIFLLSDFVSLSTAMVSWLPLPANSAEAAADASLRTVTCGGKHETKTNEADFR